MVEEKCSQLARSVTFMVVYLLPLQALEATLVSEIVNIVNSSFVCIQFASPLNMVAAVKRLSEIFAQETHLSYLFHRSFTMSHVYF